MSDEKVRYGRSQRFRLSPKGLEAMTTYQAMIDEARSGTGRAQFDAARVSWSAPRGLVPEDGLFLVEFADAGRTLPEAARNLDACGTTAKELKTAVTRLLECGMLEPVPEAPPAPTPLRRLW